MKYIYAGGMKISAEILQVLCKAGEIPYHVFSYPPSLSHRSNYFSFDELQGRFGFPLTKTKNINDDYARKVLEDFRPDWFMVFGWSQLVSEELLRIPRYGTLGFHMTKLPEGRGRAPVAWTLIKGKTEGGVSLIWLEPEADNGPIAVQRTYPISLLDDAEIVAEKVSDLACRIIGDILPDLRSGTLPTVPQDDTKASYWGKRTPIDGIIDWQKPIRKLYDFIRGITHPFPGAFSFLDGKKIMIWKVGMVELEVQYPPGKVLGLYCSHGRRHEVGIAVAANGGLIIMKSLEIEPGIRLEGERLLEMAKMWKDLQFEPEGNGFE